MTGNSRTERPIVGLLGADDESDALMRRLLRSSGLDVERSEGRHVGDELRTVDCLVVWVSRDDRRRGELFAQLERHDRRPPSVFVAPRADVTTVVSALRLGARDFFEHPLDERGLAVAVRAAAMDGIAQRRRNDELSRLESLINALTSRERETLELLLEGKSNKAIAADLHLTERAVELRRRSLMKKTGAQSFAELVRIAVTHRKLAEFGEIGEDEDEDE